MPVASVHTEQSLATFMAYELGEVAVTLGYAEADYVHAVVMAQRLYGLVSPKTVADATDIGKLEACARIAAWRKVETDTAPKFDVTTDGQSVTRSQFHAHARAMRLAAEVDGFRHGINYEVSITTRSYEDDAYLYVDADE